MGHLPDARDRRPSVVDFDYGAIQSTSAATLGSAYGLYSSGLRLEHSFLESAKCG